MGKFLLATLSTAALFGSVITTPTVSTATPDVAALTVAQRPNCNNPQTQAEMNACAGIAYQNADRRLNQVYQQLLPKLSPARQQKLRSAQQAWIRYRDTSCDFERSEVQGGTMAPTIYSSCLSDVTQRRIQELEEYLQGTDR